MSEWRKEALRQIPQLQSTMASMEVDNPMMLWIELHLFFEKLCDDPKANKDMLGRIWHYGKWCLGHSNPEIQSAAAVAFCGHLLDSEKVAKALPLVMSQLDFQGLEPLLLHHYSREKISAVLAQFSETGPELTRKLVADIPRQAEEKGTAQAATAMKTPPSGERPPFLQLLLKAVLWTPLAIFLTLALGMSWGSVLLLPCMAAAMFYSGQTGSGAAYLAGTVPAFALAMYLTKKFREEPPSLL